MPHRRADSPTPIMGHATEARFLNTLDSQVFKLVTVLLTTKKGASE